jgi:hypothetical protein
MSSLFSLKSNIEDEMQRMCRTSPTKLNHKALTNFLLSYDHNIDDGELHITF